jgi:hypothetical protein
MAASAAHQVSRVYYACQADCWQIPGALAGPMAQVTAAGPPVLFRAWLDAFQRPKYATFRRWYPRMQARWRISSLLVSLLLILIISLVLIAHDAVSDNYRLEALSHERFLAHLRTPHGLLQLFSFSAGALAAICGFLAGVVWVDSRANGPFRVRLHVEFGT